MAETGHSRQWIAAIVGIVLLHVVMRVWIEVGTDLSAHELARVNDPNEIRDFSTVDPARKFHLSVPPRVLKKMVLGFDNVAADILWMRWIQGSDIPVVDRKQQGWLYQLLSGVVTLDPKFRMAYAAGGSWLSVIRQDVEGATDILERGARMFPDDWQISLHLLYHHIYETGNTRRAAEVAQHAATLERAPPYVGRLAATLMAKDKRFDAAVAYLTQLIEQSERPEVKNAYKKRLDELITERDGVPNRSLSSTKKGRK